MTVTYFKEDWLGRGVQIHVILAWPQEKGSVNSKLSIVKTETHNLVSFSDANEKRKCHFYCTFLLQGSRAKTH